ncbi:MAG TPA: MauE/DoxX family redox-associated membrane protein [Vicinamibacteria bacterium]
MTLLANPRVQLALRLLLGAFFVYASLDKIASPAGFARIVYQWQVAGPVPSNLVAATLPWVELLAGLLLIAGVWRREAALVIALLLVVFLGAAASVLARGIDVQNCGCVSVAKEAVESAWPPAWTRGVGWFLVVRNLLMLAGALAIAFVTPLPLVVTRKETALQAPQASGSGPA